MFIVKQDFLCNQTEQLKILGQWTTKSHFGVWSLFKALFQEALHCYFKKKNRQYEDLTPPPPSHPALIIDINFFCQVT